jgi:cytoskeletal protein RodZ
MNTFSEELRKERLTKNIALADIAASTHIGIKYLEALEQGSFDILPQTYIRAFIREYALAVGLSPDEILHRYDVLVTRKYSETEDSAWNQSSFPPSGITTLPDRTPEQARVELIKQRDTRRIFLLAGIGVLMIAVVYFALNYTMKENLLRTAKETPFQEVVQEQERESNPQPMEAAVAAPAIAQDSVVLVGTTTDSVWMAMSTDENPPQEILLMPKQTHRWKAQEKFIVTLGNAGGIRFTLNGKDIGVLGKRGEVLRNITIAPHSALP